MYNNNDTQNIFDKLELRQEYEINKSVFKHVQKAMDDMNEDDCIERISFILRVYSKWLKLQNEQELQSQAQSQAQSQLADIYDIIDDYISDSYDFAIIFN